MKIILFVFATVTIIACSRNNNVPDTPPVAKFSYVVQRFLPATITTVNTSTGGGTFEWNWGDGSLSTTTDGIHTYSAPGTYLISLIQTPTTGPKDTLSITVQINQFGPSGTSSRVNTASFIYSVSYASYTVNFANNSTGGDNTYLWDFGDGTTSNSSAGQVSHVYTMPGTYHVVLSATNSLGIDTSGATISF